MLVWRRKYPLAVGRWEERQYRMQLPACLPPLCPFSIYGAAAGCNSHTTALQVRGVATGISARLRDTRLGRNNLERDH